MSNRSLLTVSLPEALNAFVGKLVASGRFASASHVVQEALTLLERRSQDREAALDEIRCELRQRGFAEAEQVGAFLGDRRGQSIRLLFPTPVVGPIRLGHSSSFGLGLFRPEVGGG